ncbi:MAG: hypothetical protein JWN04_489 [Myxococcaceae bacterium]|nr:hypothetical protein [Myxococcaceae bacterium]
MEHRVAWRAAWGLAGATLVAACGGGGNNSVVSQPGCPADGALSYASFGHQFLDEYCSSCHGGSVVGDARQGAPPEYVFDTLAQVRVHALDMHMDVVETKVMPFGQSSLKPSDALRVKFGAWLDCGAPE